MLYKIMCTCAFGKSGTADECERITSYCRLCEQDPPARILVSIMNKLPPSALLSPPYYLDHNPLWTFQIQTLHNFHRMYTFTFSKLKKCFWEAELSSLLCAILFKYRVSTIILENLLSYKLVSSSYFSYLQNMPTLEPSFFM